MKTAIEYFTMSEQRLQNHLDEKHEEKWLVSTEIEELNKNNLLSLKQQYQTRSLLVFLLGDYFIKLNGTKLKSDTLDFDVGYNQIYYLSTLFTNKARDKEVRLGIEPRIIEKLPNTNELYLPFSNAILSFNHENQTFPIVSEINCQLGEDLKKRYM